MTKTRPQTCNHLFLLNRKWNGQGYLFCSQCPLYYIRLSLWTGMIRDFSVVLMAIFTSLVYFYRMTLLFASLPTLSPSPVQNALGLHA